MKFKALAAAALLAASAASHATVTGWDSHNPVEYGFGYVAPGAFLDVFAFTVSAPLSLTASVVVSNDNNAPGLPSTHITGGAYALFLDPNASVIGGTGLDGDELQYPLYGSFCNGAGTCGFNGQTGNTINATLTLGAASYFYLVTGVADGTDGGVYTIASATVPLPVPEPETYALMLAGLAAVGAAGLRKAKKQ